MSTSFDDSDAVIVPTAGTIDALAALPPLDPPRLAEQYPIPVVKQAEVTVSPVASLLCQADATIKLCPAPDGRPLLIHVKRSSDVAEEIKSLPFFNPTSQQLEGIVADESVGSEGQKQATAQLAALESSIEALVQCAGMASLRHGIAAGHYVPPTPAKEIMGDSVLSRILNGTSPREALAKTKGVGGGFTQRSRRRFHEILADGPSLLAHLSSLLSNLAGILSYVASVRSTVHCRSRVKEDGAQRFGSEGTATVAVDSVQDSTPGPAAVARGRQHPAWVQSRRGRDLRVGREK